MDLQRYVTLMSFARSILLEELQNACMDSIRLAFSAKTGDRELPKVCGKDLHLAYDMSELRKLRFFMCFQAALQIIINHHCDAGWMDEQLTQVLEQGGDLAVDLPKLLVYCSALKPLISSVGRSAEGDWRLGTPILDTALLTD